MRISPGAALDCLKQSSVINPVLWGGCTILIGIIGLCGWIMGSRFLVTIVPKSITMAPVSAFLFIILGICICISRLSESEQDYAIIFDILLIPPVLIGLWVLYTSHSEFPVTYSWSSYSAYQIFLIAPESQMSLMSAVLFPTLSIGVFISQYLSRHGSLIFLGIMMCSMVFITGYILGHPFFYETSMKPISFLSTLGFFLSASGFWLSRRRIRENI
ncbi:hypothetical protein [uncultured Methanospirillum sp.]|uniref:hypothetical protein n=1 Tax=uncultured Methanospirillum sp. TaxID=262503 RepID=UPI0029C83581|nr:hypothetical protein [uncultured Methanospirillum sp.]